MIICYGKAERCTIGSHTNELLVDYLDRKREDGQVQVRFKKPYGRNEYELKTFVPKVFRDGQGGVFMLWERTK